MNSSRPIFFGGTFDPVHNGHLIVARAAAEALGSTGVCLIPASQSPHKQGVTPGASAEHRLALLKSAVAEDSFFDILTLELERPPPSYTYDTVDFLFRQGAQELFWMIGSDQLPALPKWHRAAELLQRVTWVVAARPGFTLDTCQLPAAFRNLNHVVVPTPRLEISATNIRERIRAGKSIRYLVPDRVEQYILTHRLYH